ncbi:DNA repair endonuclease UVH1 isoform X1 [Actinidia eriantha]|uniref:DNA repair endonuclease UVH1 isoform X1 n=2 Tax=Actinidia eriantha TaxID=165200 RepID=UPI002583A32D|nr:DNA repair endonuclease UVH1 isoform X1 [Actinidia eriantha]XP_057511389.1 DNA repair endonuclease UVH1 isoform X1 [Actinidia eriantha]
MVQFHEHIITDLLDDPGGGLVVLSSGLALPKLIASLLLLHHPSQGTLLLLSPSASVKSSILSALQLQTPNPNHQILPSEISSDLPSHHRLSLYSSGAAFFVTARILIVDLLTSRLPPSAIAGILLLNAHSLSETATEAFIVRILRSSNPSLYVRAFSDKPHAMIAGFAKAERILKCLYLRKLHLWPRFQVYVSQDLERDPPEVVDIRVSMSAHMRAIQKAVIEVMDACLKEIRKTNKVDVEDLTVENGLFKSFDEIVRRQLDPIWHTLGKKTKQLVSDLKTLRKLLDYLVRYDAVTYLKYLDSLRASENFRSVWIFAESSYKIFECAKKRVYHFGRLEVGKLVGKSRSATTKKRKLDETNKVKEDSLPPTSVVLEEVLEEAPKWKVLREVLEEIAEEREKQALSRVEPVVDGEEDDSGIVLVACKDERSCMQLEDCITKGPHKVMREEWEKYLLSKIELRVLPKHNKKKAKDPKGFGILDGVIPIKSGQKAEASTISKQEHDALLAAAAEISKHGKKDVVVGDEPQPSAESGGRAKGRGKGTCRKTSGCVPVSVERHSTSVNEAATNDKPEMLASENGGQRNETNPVVGDIFHEREPKVASLDKVILRKHCQEGDATSLKNAKQLPPVHFYALESNQHILDILKPSTIIVYHPDMAFVREIEIYKAENPNKKLKVYFLFYEDSTEVQKFDSSIRRENRAFESLIRQKSLMIIPVDQDGRCLGPSSSLDPQPITSQNSITRKAGGRKEAEKEIQVIVDMREFMSSLPNVLHQKGMRIIPVTLEVGDYILSPLICVERKSIQDLFGSFASGRLYHQVETMARYYRIPVLLIEFSQDKSFSFQSASDIGDDVTPNSILSKLSLLVIHFPRLRIVWSRSLYATAEIFASLKSNQDEPDEAKAIRVGVPSEEGIVENDVRAENYNTSAVEFLRRLPGVTDSNYRTVMDGCESLAELALLPVEKLAELMGGQKAAKTLRDFLDAKYPTLL